MFKLIATPLLLACLLAVAPGCASMMQAGCNPETAYDIGFNDANGGKPMNSARWDVCENPADQLAAIKASYRKGFESAKGSLPSTININVGGSSSSVPVAKQECIEKYGRKTCGYHCVEAYGKVACAKEPDHNCVEAFGQVKCGKNCREEYGRIKCD
jgi:hypothetical protein